MIIYCDITYVLIYFVRTLAVRFENPNKKTKYVILTLMEIVYFFIFPGKIDSVVKQ